MLFYRKVFSSWTLKWTFLVLILSFGVVCFFLERCGFLEHQTEHPIILVQALQWPFTIQHHPMMQYSTSGLYNMDH